ncbi:MAG: sigma-54-dependent transcriptional regulator [Vicinamibacteria bacterium]
MSARGSILLVDDEERIAKSLGRALREEGHEVVTAGSAEEAKAQLAARGFDLLVVDNRMPGKSGLDLIRELAGAPEPERPAMVMMTAHATVASAIEAIKLGALDYLQKPFEVEELLVVARRALELQRLRRQQRYLLQEREEEFGHYGIVGSSPAIRELLQTLERVARSRSTVLITGETGTGKELAARAIHDRSAEREMPLVRVNCAAIPDALIESELFGHVRGAFTGASGAKRGKFALADGGTIFLDEIGRLGMGVQAKLLRVLQEREVEPLGASRPHSIDVRVVAATNRDLSRLVAEGAFQEDLFYRLNVIPVVLPPLRDRREDVPLLAEHFARKHAQRLGRPAPALAPEALERLQAYHWPGNVRELENAIERAVVLGGGPTIGAAELVPHGGGAAAGAALPCPRLKDNVEWAERESVAAALRQARGVKKDAAEILGISQRALSYYLSKYPAD